MVSDTVQQVWIRQKKTFAAKRSARKSGVMISGD